VTRLAQWIMVSPLNAAIVCVLMGVSGLFAWLAPVPAVLYLMRKGPGAATIPLAGLLAITAFFASQGEPTLAGSAVASVVSALILRQKTSLPLSLVVASALAMVYTAVLREFAGEQLNGLLTQYQQTMTTLVQPGDAALSALTVDIFVHLIGIWVGVSAAINLFIARSMQARLYNPGGFRQEFHGLRLTPSLNALCVTPMLVAMLWPDWAFLEGIGMTPILLAGLGLVHGIVAQKQWGSGPLLVFYVMLVIMAPVVTPLLLMVALADSFFDFRQKAR